VARGVVDKAPRDEHPQQTDGAGASRPMLPTVVSDDRQTPKARADVLAGMNLPQSHRADLFRSLHTTAHPLALVTVWDVASALAAQDAGAPAIATTSAGVAWSQGVPDGDHLDRARAVSVLAAIVSAVDVPVSADIEGGYPDSTGDVAETVRAVIEAGAVGINIEDGSRSPDELCRRIAVARRVADETGVALFVNARCDVYLTGAVAPAQRLAETVRRAAAYVEAGADGIFVPGVVDAQTIAALAGAVQVPFNVMVGPGALDVAGLGRLGVARASLGSSAAQAAATTVRDATAELLATGTYDCLTGALDYGYVDGLLTRASSSQARRGATIDA